MKALTICQPYAHLITTGEKLIENRTWPTQYRGPLAIHAGKSREWMDDEDFEQYPDLPFGAVVATARLLDCIPLGRVGTKYPHLKDHPHANGPWCWVLHDVQKLDTPIVCGGKQGLWEFEPNPVNNPTSEGT